LKTKYRLERFHEDFKTRGREVLSNFAAVRLSGLLL
jgi:hypothetical protein